MESLNEHYVPLIQSGDSKNSFENASTHFRDEPCFSSKAKRSSIVTKLLVVFLLIIGVSQSIVIAFLYRSEQKQCTQSLSGAIPMRTVERQLFMPNSFVSENETEASAAWDAIEAGHGEVNIDPKWAVARGLPPSMIHPVDQEKMVYSIAAYHAIHCLKYIREHYIAFKEGKEIYWDMPHDIHCFDSLRQNIMCTADDNLLYATGHRDAGHGQMVQCKDWDALRDWATERTSCYHDFQGSLKGHWGHCDGGEDGLPYDSLL